MDPLRASFDMAADHATRPAPPTGTERELRDKIDEFVGSVFYGQLFKAMQNSSLKGKIGHGGRGEEVFAGQLHMELAQRAGRARSFDLSDAIYRTLDRRREEDASHGHRYGEPQH